MGVWKDMKETGKDIGKGIEKGAESAFDGIDDLTDAAFGDFIKTMEKLSASAKKFNDLMTSLFLNDIVALPNKVAKLGDKMGDMALDLLMLMGSMFIDIIVLFFQFWAAIRSNTMKTDLGLVIYWGAFIILILYANKYIYAFNNMYNVGLPLYVVSYASLYTAYVNWEKIRNYLFSSIWGSSQKILLIALDATVKEGGKLIGELFKIMKKEANKVLT